MKTHIDLTSQQVSGASTGSGMVTATNWNPGDNYAREQEIQAARMAALEEQRKQEEAQQPINLRMEALEREVFKLKALVMEMKDA